MSVELSLLLAIATAFAAGSRWLPSVQAQSTYREYHLDKSWGDLKGSMGSFLLFEDGKGDVRVVNKFASARSRIPIVGTPQELLAANGSAIFTVRNAMARLLTD